MLEETYIKFKKNILPKMKKMQPNLQEPKIEYCEPEQVIDICSYNHYPVIEKAKEEHTQSNDDNDIYDMTELEHEFEYSIYEDIFKTEEFMAELKRLDKAENETRKLRNINFPLEQFSDAGKVANEGDPQLKAAADNELYELEKHAIQMDMNNNIDANTSTYTDDNTDDSAEEYTSPHIVSHMQHETNSEKFRYGNDDNMLRKTVYGPTYVPYKEEGQKILLPQSTNMSQKDNLKHLYNSQPEGMCDNKYESLNQGTIDTETFSYSHETSTQHVLAQGVYVGSASPLIAGIKTEPYSIITYTDDGMLTGTYDNTHKNPIYIDNGTTLNIMPTHFYEKAYYLHHLLKEDVAAKSIHTGNRPVKTHFWIDILLDVQGCMIQFKF